MIITTLVENTAADQALRGEHGLSLHIRTPAHQLLFDTGASDLFAENAQKLGIDLTQVDLAVLSHGHYDHGGGLPAFLDLNSRAKIYLHEKSRGHFYSRRPDGTLGYIGLDRALLERDRLIFTGDRRVIDDELSLFAGVTGTALVPTGNCHLLQRSHGQPVPDDFSHEQNLIIREGDLLVLIAGCAHRGILNIVEAFRQTQGRYPNVVIGGFHLYHHTQQTGEDPGIIAELAQELMKTGAMFYTGHCTGEGPFEQMKKIMGDHLEYLATGRRIQLPLTPDSPRNQKKSSS